MNIPLVSFFFAVGVGGWVYYQVSRRMQGNTKAILLSTVGAAAVAFFIFYSLFTIVLPSN